MAYNWGFLGLRFGADMNELVLKPQLEAGLEVDPLKYLELDPLLVRLNFRGWRLGHWLNLLEEVAADESSPKTSNSGREPTFLLGTKKWKRFPLESISLAASPSRR